MDDIFNLSAGLKYTHVKNRGIFDFFNGNSGASVFNNVLSEDFDYNETVYTAFAKLDKERAAWSPNLVLRAEQTEIAGNNRTLGTVNTQIICNSSLTSRLLSSKTRIIFTRLLTNGRSIGRLMKCSTRSAIL
jgi:hypothetical protein